MPSPRLESVVLSGEERLVLVGWARRRTTAQALAMRARIVLRAAEGGAIGQVAADLGVSRDMVSKWRSRFLAARLEGLSDEPRPGRPRVITDDRVEQVITKTLDETPAQDTHWSTRSMACADGAVADGGLADLAGCRVREDSLLEPLAEFLSTRVFGPYRQELLDATLKTLDEASRRTREERIVALRRAIADTHTRART